MPSKKAYSSSSFSSSSSSSSSSQLTTPREFQHGSSRAIAKSPLWDVEIVKSSHDFSIPKSDKEVREEIVELETEIFRLERYLLSLYRTSFGDHLSASLLPDESSLCLKTPPSLPYTTTFHNDRVSSASDTPSKIQRSERGHPSLADLLGLNTLTLNKLSEEILRLICEIHLKLSDNLVNNSKNRVISKECGHELGVVIHNICLDDGNLKSVEAMLQNFRSLVLKLEKVDPGSMAHEEKLAFWINIHNALVMHGYIVHGICEVRTSRMVMKASFNIGGEWVNAYDVQSSILRIRAYRSPNRLRKLFSAASSSKTYALDYTEPLLHFALSTGASSDPMVRVYTPEGIFQQLWQARNAFIRTSVIFEKETNILLPKIIYNYAKDSSLHMAELFNIISECLVETQRTTMERVLKLKQDRCIRWINHDANFRYIIDWELVKGDS